MQIQPYLFFEGRCEEALSFYREALDAEVTELLRYKDHPEPNEMIPPGSGEKVMHASMRIGDTEVMVSDGMCSGSVSFDSIRLALTGLDETQAEAMYQALSASGKVDLPLQETFFSPRFAMVTDHFGVLWMIVATPRE